MDINKVFLIGRLTRDAELKQLNTTTVSNFALAVNRRVRSAEGQWSDEVNYFDIELYGKQGEAIQAYLKKGKQVAVEGVLKQNRWEDANGQKRSRIVIVALNVQLLGGGSGSGQSQTSQADSGAGFSGSSQYSAPGPGDIDDDIPF